MMQIITLIGGYIALLALLSLVARPARRGLASISNRLSTAGLSEHERHMVNVLLATSYSWRAAPIIAMSFLTGLLQSVPSLDDEAGKIASAFPNLFQTTDMHRLFEYHLASVAAVNPLFGVLAYAARWAFRVKLYSHHRSRKAIEQIELIGMKAIA